MRAWIVVVLALAGWSSGCNASAEAGTTSRSRTKRPAPPAERGQGDLPRDQVVINEIVARPAEGPDWIELYNRGAAEVDLSGAYLTDDPDQLGHYYQFPAGTRLAPGARLVVLADDGKGAGEGHHARFKLAANEGVFLLRHDGVALDAVPYITREKGGGLARLPDGEGRLYQVSEPTPGAANQGARR